MSINSKLISMKAVLRSFTEYPRGSVSLLKQLFSINRGFEYSKDMKMLNQEKLSQSSDEPNPLEKYFNSIKEGNGIWKWDHYFDVYHTHFKKFRNEKVNICEIGIYSGGSLEMWKSYFGDSCVIYGIDIESACKVYENENIRVFIGDQEDREFWKHFKEQNIKIDILIDDGGHSSEQQIITFEEMLPIMSPGGIYLCEDIHGGFHGFTAYLYGVLNHLNSPNTRDKPTSFQGWIKSINFYPFITVIEKRDTYKEKFIAPKHGTKWQPFYNE
jgi:hypothetical protein